MNAITLHEPWASAMKHGLKLIETRSWPTKHRGLLALHAGTHVDEEACRRLEFPLMRTSPGTVLGVLAIEKILPMTPELIAKQTPQEFEWGDWKPGRFAWVLRPLEWLKTPIKARGHQRVWDWTSPEASELDGRLYLKWLDLLDEERRAQQLHMFDKRG